MGSSVIKVSLEEIKSMFLSTNSNQYENNVSENQQLTFNYLEEKFKEQNLILKLDSLNLKNKNGFYNNAALLLSDQNPRITKFCVLNSNEKRVFLDKKEFTGSLIKQLDEILYLLKILNKNKIVFNEIKEREENLDYPYVAIRETIINAFCHRNWFLSGEIIVDLYLNRIKILSPGHVVDNLTLEEMKKGYTATRNPLIINVMNKLKLIENYGSGIQKIFSEYQNYWKQPEFTIDKNGVIVELFNRNYDENDTPHDTLTKKIFNNTPNKREKNKINNIINDTPHDTPHDTRNKIESNRMDLIIKIMQDNPKITLKEISIKLNISLETVKRDVKKLKVLNLLEYVGHGKYGVWKCK